MQPILIPKPKNAMNPDRPVNALLQAQIEHLQHVERRLPLRYRSEIYTRAIRTEGEAGEYIRQVTEAIHRAHADASAKRAKGKSRAKKGLTLAAAAARRRKKRSSKSTIKKKGKNARR